MIDSNKPSETPWGQSWADVVASLQPAASTRATIASIAAEVTALLKGAGIEHELIIAGAHGRGTALPADTSLRLLARVPEFREREYHTAHLAQIAAALKPLAARQAGLFATFAHSGFSVSVAACGELYNGPAHLVTIPSRDAPILDVLLATSCEALRAHLHSLVPPFVRDMARVAKKWRADAAFLHGEDAPSDYLLELVMLHAARNAAQDLDRAARCAAAFRSFLAIFAGISGSRTFLSWEFLYERAVVDAAIAAGRLDLSQDSGSIVVVDPAAPVVNVAHGFDWGPVRAHARKSLDGLQSTELVESLQLRLAALTKGVEESMEGLRRQVSALEAVERAPRRWSGSVQFGEACMAGDSWALVTEVELRGILWRVNARRARLEDSGYSGLVDVSLQMIGKVKHALDVDVVFRGGTSNLVFDDKIDHVLVAKKSEIVRNRDYSMQITVIS